MSSYKTSLLLSLLISLRLALSATVTYDWAATWTTANPDGRYDREIVGINGQWPCPTIQGNIGDEIVVNLKNELVNQTTSLHFHGLYQQGSNNMDGPPGVTQCPIWPGDEYTYKFTLQQPGTYWYHSHSPGQYIDGLRGPLIINDPNNPYKNEYDDQFVVTLTDWYHDQFPTLVQQYLSSSEDPDGGEPVPYSALLNEATNTRYNIQAGKTYFVRIINMAGFSQLYLNFDQHDVIIIEADGVYTEPRQVESLYVAVAQRYGVLLKAKTNCSENFAITTSLDETMFDDVPAYVDQNCTGYLIYDNASPLPDEKIVDKWNVIDDFTLVPHDQMPLLSGTPDVGIELDISFFQFDDQNRAAFNNVTYIGQKVPSIYTAMTTGEYSTDPRVYGEHSNAQVLPYNGLVEIVVNNYDTGAHPIHTHGHAPQMVARSYTGTTTPAKRRRSTDPLNELYKGLEHHSRNSPPRIPARRDTWMVPAGGYTVIRFIASNPGIWLMHCHMEWHVSAGLLATLIEAPTELQNTLTLDPAMAALCKQHGIPTEGNAAANTKDFLDLTGARNTVNGPPWGSNIPGT